MQILRVDCYGPCVMCVTDADISEPSPSFRCPSAWVGLSYALWPGAASCTGAHQVTFRNPTPSSTSRSCVRSTTGSLPGGSLPTRLTLRRTGSRGSKRQLGFNLRWSSACLPCSRDGPPRADAVELVTESNPLSQLVGSGC